MTISKRTFGHLQVHRFPENLLSEIKIHCIRNKLNRQDFIIRVLAKAVGINPDTLPSKLTPQSIKSKHRREAAAKAVVAVAEGVHE